MSKKLILDWYEFSLLDARILKDVTGLHIAYLCKSMEYECEIPASRVKDVYELVSESKTQTNLGGGDYFLHKRILTKLTKIMEK